MKNFKHTIQYTGNPKEVWDLWSDVPSWNKWDTSIKTSQIFGNFEPGTEGEIIPMKGPKIHFIISQVSEMKSFHNIAKIPLGTIEFFHEFDGKNVTHGFKIQGISSWIFGKILGKQISKDIITSLENIQNYA